MGAFIGILFLLLTLIYQSVSLDDDFINKKRNQEFRKNIEKNIDEEFYKLSKIEESVKNQNYTKFNFIKNNCNDNYSNILICQKRHALKIGDVNKDSLNPSKEFCQAFYNYIKYTKGINGRITINEVKELLMEVNTINSNSDSVDKFILDRLYVETTADKEVWKTFEMEDFTVDKMESIDDVSTYKQEFKNYNLRKYNNYFRATDDYDDSRLHERSNHPFSYKISIKSTIKNNKILFDGNIVKFYAILEDHNRQEVKKEGVKTFINTYFDKILKYREILLKIKRISPEIDLFMEKTYNDKSEILTGEIRYQEIYEELYLKYKGLLTVLNMSDEALLIKGDNDIKTLIDSYKDFDLIDGLVDEIEDFDNFKFKGVVYEQPFSSKGKTQLTKAERKELNSQQVCDLERYIREVQY